MQVTTSLFLSLLFSCGIYDSTQLGLSPAQQSIINDLSWGTRSLVLAESDPRRVGVELLVEGQETTAAPEGDDEIKLKLFRMMYESISDSDAKIKRADMIRRAYENNTSFELGFIVADAMDKFSSMMDVSQMLLRLYNDWKPIEHINAYEHIANKGIEITQLIEMAKAVSSRTPETQRRAFVNVGL